jgi:mannobiose 2-epimerase
MHPQSALFKKEVEQELEDILRFWTDKMSDGHGGFHGQMDAQGNIHPHASRGSVLQSRILWTFSAAYRHTGSERWLETADGAYRYLQEHFTDPGHAGIYWTTDHQGRPLDMKKQVYAQAFAIYGLSEYFRCRPVEAARDLAVQLFRTIEAHAFDEQETGYIDAFARDWSPLQDIRLSKKDANEKKTMNTHLHILEAYTSLYGVWQDGLLKKKILLLLDNFRRHIIDPDTHHLVLYFDEHWNRRSEAVSFGHDIEASWLVQEAAEAVRDKAVLAAVIRESLQMAQAAAEGLDTDGGMWEGRTGEAWIREKHWWPQAEAMVGFLNAWQHTGQESFFNRAFEAWNFIKKHLRSPGGEWWWGIREDGSVMPGEDKAGLWKCPYHNGRACIEVARRLRTFG